MKHLNSLRAMGHLIIRRRDSALILEAVRDIIASATYDPESLTSLRTALWQRRLMPVRLPNGMGTALPRSLAADYLMQLACEDTEYPPERATAAGLIGLLDIPDLIPRMLRLAESPWPDIRCQAFTTLRREITGFKPYLAKLEQLLYQEHNPGPLAALLDLIESVGPELLPPIAESEFWNVLLDQPNHSLRQSVYRILQNRGRAANVYSEAVASHLADDLPVDLRISAIVTIGKIITCQTEPIKRIADCLQVKNERVAIAVFEVLTALGPRAKAVLPHLTLAMLGRNIGRRSLATKTAESLLEPGLQGSTGENEPKLLLLAPARKDKRHSLLEIVRLRIPGLIERGFGSGPALGLLKAA